MIIRDDGATTDENLTKFTLVSVDGSAELSVALPTTFIDDFREHLTTHGFHVPPGATRSALTEVVVATAQNPAAWTAVGGTLVAFLRRHRGKVHRFEVDGRSVSIEGYSAKEAERLAAELARADRKRHDEPAPGGMTLGRR
ncbi:effector-associated constant component EACC1 [Actinosynnema sp. CA-248983]